LLHVLSGAPRRLVLAWTRTVFTTQAPVVGTKPRILDVPRLVRHPTSTLLVTRRRVLGTEHLVLGTRCVTRDAWRSVVVTSGLVLGASRRVLPPVLRDRRHGRVVLVGRGEGAISRPGEGTTPALVLGTRAPRRWYPGIIAPVPRVVAPVPRVVARVPRVVARVPRVVAGVPGHDLPCRRASSPGCPGMISPAGGDHLPGARA